MKSGTRHIPLVWQSVLCFEKTGTFCCLTKHFSNISRTLWAVTSSSDSLRTVTRSSRSTWAVTSSSSSSKSVTRSISSWAVINSRGLKPVNQNSNKPLLIKHSRSMHNVRFSSPDDGKEKMKNLNSTEKKETIERGGDGGPSSGLTLGVSGVIVGVVVAFYFYARNKREVLAEETGKDRGTLYSEHNYMEYTPGTTNLIISVPHDGFLHPTSIPDRVDGCRDSLGGLCHFPWTPDCPSAGPNTDEWYCRATTYSDTFTQEMGRELVEELTRLTGSRPYLVVSNLHRSKMDPNRDINRAAHGNKDGEDAYRDFHKFIQQAKDALDGPGLLIDLHGHTHPHEKVEVGYLYQPKDINKGDFSKDVSSMNSLLERTGMSPKDLLAGEHSLGALFEKEGYSTIPSPRQPSPGEDKYFRGGWTTQNHGSRDGGEVDALQIEVPVGIREGPQQGKKEFTKAMAKVIAEFHKRYYTV